MDTEILYGVHPIFEAICAKKRSFKKIYLSGGQNRQKIKQLIEGAELNNIPIENVTKNDIKKLTASDFHQGICALVSKYTLTDFNDIIDLPNLFALILDNIVDTHNLGALIRTSQAVGVNCVIISKDRSAKPSPPVSKSSAGAMEHMKIVMVTNVTSTIKQLKNKNVWIAGLDKEEGENIYNADLKGSLALVIGGEEKGIRNLVKKNCDFLISIPQKGQINSLNASVAGAVAMYEAFRQRSL